MAFIKNSLNRLYQQLETDDHELLYLFLEITRQCNLNCLHCGSDCKSEKQTPELTAESWIKIIDYCALNFSPELVFVLTGGEPLLHAGLEKIGRRIIQTGHRWGMVTNGMALTEKKWASVMDAGIYSITVSLDGNEASHDKIRNRKGAYKRVLQALSIIGDSTVMMKDVVTCAYPANIDCLEETAQVLIDSGITSWRIFRIFPSGRADGNSDLLLDFNETNRLLDWIALKRDDYRRQGLNLTYSCEGWMPLKRDITVRDQPFFCRAGVNIASILCDGTITGCSNNAPFFYEGNILKNDLKQTWEEGFQKFRNRDWAKTGPCADCRFFKDCRGSSIHLWKNADTPIAFCYAKDLSSKTNS